jgi:hypothetical protein
MATYIGTKYGDEASQEWTRGKRIAYTKPAYSQVIMDRHALRVKAIRECIELSVRRDPKVLRRVSRILVKEGLHFANLFYIFE